MSDVARFIEWAGREGYDTANSYDTDRSRWVFFNPMTADLWRAWLASRKEALEEAAQIAEDMCDHFPPATVAARIRALAYGTSGGTGGAR